MWEPRKCRWPGSKEQVGRKEQERQWGIWRAVKRRKGGKVEVADNYYEKVKTTIMKKLIHPANHCSSLVCLHFPSSYPQNIVSLT